MFGRSNGKKIIRLYSSRSLIYSALVHYFVLISTSVEVREFITNIDFFQISFKGSYCWKDLLFASAHKNPCNLTILSSINQYNLLADIALI